ncbi:MAG: Holliday junction resolvase RuvX [bacterium]|nr:Holliday junction resolvase RuvX [bacterium]
MGKFIALDIGEKRVGVAHSDDMGSFAFPLMTLNADENIGAELDKVIHDEKPEKIVVGQPRNMDGTLGFQAERVKEFVKKYLTSYDTLVDYEDESVTSIEAEKLMKMEGKDPRKEKSLIDMYAAKIILESYLER